MKIINVNHTDTGGQCYRLSKMINDNYPEHNSRAFIKHVNYINYDYDVLFDSKWNEIGIPKWITEFWESADIFHVHNKWRYGSGWANFNPNAGKIIHQHGNTPVIKKHWTADKINNAIRVVSTLNLLPQTNTDNIKRWFPTPIEVDNLTDIKNKYYEPHDTINILHTPTQPHLKHTELFLKIFNQLKDKYHNINLIYATNINHQESLKLKCNADICFDQLLYQHGSSGLEAMAMGVPVVAGHIYNPFVEDLFKQHIGYIPYMDTNEDNLYSNLEKLIIDKSLRDEVGYKGFEYVKKWHTYPYVTELAIETYKEAMELKK